MKVLKKYNRGDEVKELQRKLNVYVDGYFGALTEEAVKSFQKSKGLVADGIVGPLTWTELNKASKSFIDKKSRRNIKEIIVHCTATPEGMDVSVEDIRCCHLVRGFSDIGYHYVIYRNGEVHNGRDVDVSGAHCVNHNYISIGVCYVGGVDKDGKTPKDTRTEAQKLALSRLLKRLKEMYPNATIHGHREFANKACPSFDAKAEYSNL